MMNYHDQMIVQERVERLRREAEEDRLVRDATLSRRRDRARRREEAREARQRGRAAGRRPVPGWGTGA